MRVRIQKSMLLVLFVTLALSYLFFSIASYRQTMHLLRNEVHQEADYIVTAVELLGGGYLEEMDAVDENTRLTMIREDGTVKYDSRRDGESLENHGGRPEVKAAFRNGEGEDVRFSSTVGKEMYYYARLLEDGTVLRVSKTVDGLARIALGLFPEILIMGLTMFLLAGLLSDWQTRRLIAPINALDVEKPMDTPVYEELKPLLVKIDAQNREKDAIADMRKEFSANVSHELKTPLTSISGYAEIMRDGLVRQEDMKDFAGRIHKEARRLITLVEDIIKLSKLDEGAVELEKEDVDLFELTREICSRLAPQAEEKHVRISIAGEHVIYHGIRQVLDEMIYNLCENAVKYNVENGRMTVWTGDTLSGPKVVVSDTGIGIAQEHHERIFERFYRVDKSHSKERGGTGLGLSIVKHGAQLHKANVSVESEPGRGTRIQIQF